MKNKFFTLFIFCLLCSENIVLAQMLKVEERTVKNEESIELNSWTAILDQDMNYCMETYGDFIKEFFKTKVDKRSKAMLVAEKTLFPELSDLRLDQRAIFLTETGGTAVSITFSPGYDIHFGHDSYQDEFKKAEAFVKNFVRYHYKSFYNEKIKSIEDKIKSKQNDIESNGKKTDRNNKAIEDNKAAGDSDKTKVKNDKLVRENESYAADSASKRAEVSDLEAELAKVKESLRKVDDFK